MSSPHSDQHSFAQDSSLPPGWETSVDPSTGRTFYVNHATQQTSWYPPSNAPLPPGWEQYEDEEGRMCYIETETRRTTWEDPRLTQFSTPTHRDVAVASAASTTSTSERSHLHQQHQEVAYPKDFSSNASKPKFVLKRPSVDTATPATSSGWACAQCTFVNDNSSTECSVCGAAGGNPEANQLASDEAMAKALQQSLNQQQRPSSSSTPAAPAPAAKPAGGLLSMFGSQTSKTDEDADDDSEAIDRSPDFVVTEPFELAPSFIPDEVSKSCTKCSAVFTWRLRRHHCRCCGMLACDACTSKRVPVRLPGTVNEAPQRVCDACFDHISEGHAHCMNRYATLASAPSTSGEHREMAVRGMAEVLENLPRLLSSTRDFDQGMRDLEVVKFIGGPAKLCSFLSPGDAPSMQSEACRLVAALVTCACTPDSSHLTKALSKRLVANDLCEGVAMPVMATCLAQSDSRSQKAFISTQISILRILMLLGEYEQIRRAVVDSGLAGPICDALLATDASVQDWSTMALTKLLKPLSGVGSTSSLVDAVVAHQGIQNLVMLLSSTNHLVQEHAAVAIGEALASDTSNNQRVKRALSGLSGTPTVMQMVMSAAGSHREGTGQLLTAGLRLLLVLSESEADAVRTSSSNAIPFLVSIINSSTSTENPTDVSSALQILVNVANVGVADRNVIVRAGGLAAAVTMMKQGSSENKRYAAQLVESLSSDPDGAMGVMHTSGGISGLVDAVASSGSNASAASGALATIMTSSQGPEAQAALLDSGALEALLESAARSNSEPTAARVIDATHAFVVGDSSVLLPRLAASIPPPTLASKLCALSRIRLYPHSKEKLLLVLAALCGAKSRLPDELDDLDDEEEELSGIILETASQSRSVVLGGALGSLIVPAIQSGSEDPGVALAALKCSHALLFSPTHLEEVQANENKFLASGGLGAVNNALDCGIQFGGHDNANSRPAHFEIILYAEYQAARLIGGTSRKSSTALSAEALGRVSRSLDKCMEAYEPRVMLSAVYAFREASFQATNWSHLAKNVLPRIIEMLLADKTGMGPNGHPPLSSKSILRLLMDASIITSNLAKLEANCVMILEAGGVLALVNLLSEPNDEAAMCGVRALSALSETSKRCATAICRADDALTALMHLSEQNRRSDLKAASLNLVRRLAQIDPTSFVSKSSGDVLDSMIRIVRFEPDNQQAQDALCGIASAEEDSTLLKRLVEHRDASTVLLLLRNASSSSRLKGQAMEALAQMSRDEFSNEVVRSSSAVLSGIQEMFVSLLAPSDVLGGDKSESPAMEAARALASMTEVSFGEDDELNKVLAVPEIVSALWQLLVREHRLGRSKSSSTGNAFRSLRHVTRINPAIDYWTVGSIANAPPERTFTDKIQVITMALDAFNRVAPATPESFLVCETICWTLSKLPPRARWPTAAAKLSEEVLSRLVRPVSTAFDLALNSTSTSFRVEALRAITRLVAEPGLAMGFVTHGCVRSATNYLTKSEDGDDSTRIEATRLLAALIKSATSTSADDNGVRSAAINAVANSGALKSVVGYIVDEKDEERTKEILASLAVLCRFGGKLVCNALVKSDTRAMSSVVAVAGKGNADALSILARLAFTSDELREQCVQAVDYAVVGLSHADESVRVSSLDLLSQIALVDRLPTPALKTVAGFCAKEQPASAKTLACHVLWAASHRVPREEFVELLEAVTLELLVDTTSNSRLFARLCSMYPEECGATLFEDAGALTRICKAGLTEEEDGFVLEAMSSVAAAASPAQRASLRTAWAAAILSKRPTSLHAMRFQRVLGVLNDEEELNSPRALRKPPQQPAPLTPVKSSAGSPGGTMPRLPSPLGPPPGPPPPSFGRPGTSSNASVLSVSTNATANHALARTFSQPPPPPPPPEHSRSPSSAKPKNACEACTFNNESGASACAMCGSPLKGLPSAGSVTVACQSCRATLRGPSTASALTCPQCRETTPLKKSSAPLTSNGGGKTKVRCKSCLSELLAETSSKQFKCPTCGEVGNSWESQIPT